MGQRHVVVLAVGRNHFGHAAQLAEERSERFSAPPFKTPRLKAAVALHPDQVLGRDWLAGQQMDGTNRIQSGLSDYLGEVAGRSARTPWKARALQALGG